MSAVRPMNADGSMTLMLLLKRNRVVSDVNPTKAPALMFVIELN